MAGYISGDTRKVTTHRLGGNEAERREDFYAYFV